MCGIYFSNKNFDRKIVSKKMESIKSRGPDNTTIEFMDGLILAHNRLSIIDLDKRSNQPMTYEHLTIVFNGEIYNFKELKSDLIAKQYHFKTSSDTELILAMYLEYGPLCLNFFNGMFAFVIYDKLKKEVFLARDRVGQKPLYYSIVNGSIEICSQIKQFDFGNNYTINADSVDAFFKYKYIPEPMTIYNEIKKFPAASYAYYDLKTNKFLIKSFWKISNNIIKSSFNNIKSKLSHLVESSVKYRLISDVPVGVFLSGGIDSSLVSYYAQKNSYKPIKTFCVKFNETEFDESGYAKKISEFLGTQHTTIECSINQIQNFITNFNSAYDEPFADSSALPSLLLNNLTKKYVTVVLTGDGGDESFLGYNRYDLFYKYQYVFKIPFFIRNLISRFISIYNSPKSKIISSLINQDSQQNYYHRIIQVLDQEYFNGDPTKNYFTHNGYLYDNKSMLSNISRFDIKTYLCDDINVKVDRASMYNSIETRSPLLDFRVLELANQLEIKYKFYKSSKKIILKEILGELMPKHLFNRPKSGFTIPLNEWFRTSLKEFVLDNLTEKNLKMIPNLNLSISKNMISDHMNKKVNKSNEIWKLLVLTSWLNSR